MAREPYEKFFNSISPEERKWREVAMLASKDAWEERKVAIMKRRSPLGAPFMLCKHKNVKNIEKKETLLRFEDWKGALELRGENLVEDGGGENAKLQIRLRVSKDGKPVSNLIMYQ